MNASKKLPRRKRGGRPTDYRASFCSQAYKFCLLGATNVDLAKFFGVTGSTLDLWISNYPKFSGAIKAGREEADAHVGERLYERAMGYSHPEVVITQYEGVITKTPVVKHYPPDTTACIFWLKNRQRDKWRDVQRLEHTGKDGGPVETTNASVTDLLAELVKRGEQLPTCAQIPILQRS